MDSARWRSHALALPWRSAARRANPRSRDKPPAKNPRRKRCSVYDSMWSLAWGLVWSPIYGPVYGTVQRNSSACGLRPAACNLRPAACGMRETLCGALSTALSTALCRGIHRFDPWFQSAVWRARGHRAHWAQPTVARADDVRRGKRRRRHCASGYDFRTFAWSVDARCCVTTVRYRVRTALQQPDAAFGRRGSELCAGEIPASK